MEFRDLKAQYNTLQDEINSALLNVIESGIYIGGSEVSRLERSLADYVGAKHCVTCGNGTDALQLALMSWGIGAGDAVLVPDFTFFSSGEVVSAIGATPIFVDVDEHTYNIDPDQIEPAFRLAEEKGLSPKAIIPVDLFGLPADYPIIRPICENLGLLILEDGAQGFGGSIDGKMACSFGDISTTSFFPAKPFGCYGDGGAVFTDNDEWADLIRSYAVHGKGSMKYDNIRIGMNSRLDSVQAATLLAKMDAFVTNELEAVNKAAMLYSNTLLPLLERGVVLPHIPERFTSSWAQYTIQLPTKRDREQLQIALRDDSIPTMVYYPKPMHEQTAFKGISLCLDGCNTSEKLSMTVLSLPIGPYIAEADVGIVCQNILSFFEFAN